jgi:hypothetical protein
MFKPSTTQAPVIFNANPAAYQLQREKFPKGDKRRIMTRSDLWDFRQCPSRWMRSVSEDPTKAMEWGGLMDVLVLTPHLFERTYAVAPAQYDTKGMQCQTMGCEANGTVTDAKKCAKCRVDRVEIPIKKDWDWNAKVCDEWREARRKEGKITIKESLASDAYKAKKRLEEDTEIAAILAESEKQVQINVEWHDKETGLVIPVSCLIDILPPPDGQFGDTFFDLKETADARAVPWGRRVHNDGLYYQGAIYLDAINAATGKKYRTAAHVIQESTAPWECTMRPIGDKFMNTGAIDYKNDLRDYSQSLLRGKWRGFDRDPSEQELWMIKSAEY